MHLLLFLVVYLSILLKGLFLQSYARLINLTKTTGNDLEPLYKRVGPVWLLIIADLIPAIIVVTTLSFISHDIGLKVITISLYIGILLWLILKHVFKIKILQKKI